jgi:hypothetical protein
MHTLDIDLFGRPNLPNRCGSCGCSTIRGELPLRKHRTLPKTTTANGLSCGSVLKLIGCTKCGTWISRPGRKPQAEQTLYGRLATKSATFRRETSRLMQLIKLPWSWLPGPAASTPCTEHLSWRPAVGSSPFPISICTARRHRHAWQVVQPTDRD